MSVVPGVRVLFLRDGKVFLGVVLVPLPVEFVLESARNLASIVVFKGLLELKFDLFKVRD